MCYAKCHIVEDYSLQGVTYDVMFIIHRCDISRPLGNLVWTLLQLVYNTKHQKQCSITS